MRTVWAVSLVFALGSIPVAHANGTVKCEPKAKHHPHKAHKHVHHAPCHQPVCPPEPACFQTGFYAGLQGGYSLLHGKYQNSLFDVTIPLTTPVNKSLSNSGIVGEVLLGGRYVWDNCMITGVEVSGLIDSNRLTHNFFHPVPPLATPDIFSSQFRRKYAVIPSVVLGYQFCQRWQAFLKLGASFSRFKIKEKHESNLLTFVGTKQKTTFMPGIGLEYAVNCLVSFQGTFAYERYSKVKKFFQPVFSDPLDAASSYTVKVKNPQYYTLKFGMLVKF